MAKGVRRPIRATILAALVAACGSGPEVPALPLPDWPPRLNQPYPDIELTDVTGQKVRISDFKGKIVILEPIGMSCAACNAFCGANLQGGPGGFENITPQAGLPSFEQYVSRYGSGISLRNPEFVYLQVLFFNTELEAPTIEDARNWDRHFGVSANPNRKVLFADARFLEDKHYQATYNLIPGFHLIDRNRTLRIDAAGHHPPHTIHGNLVPMMAHLLYES